MIDDDEIEHLLRTKLGGLPADELDALKRSCRLLFGWIDRLPRDLQAADEPIHAFTPARQPE